MTGFNKVMRFCNTLQDYESAKNQGTITDDLFVVILQDKLAKFKGQTFDWSQNADLTALATKGELEDLAEEIASNERVWAEALNDLNERINEIGTGGGGGTSDIVVDAALSTTSTNAIQNKAVANALNEKADASALASKQDTLVSGTNIKTVQGQSILGSGNISISVPTVDAALSSTSTNAVQNKVVKAAIDELDERIGELTDELMVEDITDIALEIDSLPLYGKIYFDKPLGIGTNIKSVSFNGVASFFYWVNDIGSLYTDVQVKSSTAPFTLDKVVYGIATPGDTSTKVTIVYEGIGKVNALPFIKEEIEDLSAKVEDVIGKAEDLENKIGELPNNESVSDIITESKGPYQTIEVTTPASFYGQALFAEPLRAGTQVRSIAIDGGVSWFYWADGKGTLYTDIQVKATNTPYILDRDVYGVAAPSSTPITVTIAANSSTEKVDKVARIDADLQNLKEDVEDINSAMQGLKNRKKWDGKTIVAFGDSITHFIGSDNKTYSEHLADITGANVINCGIGGATYRQRATPQDSTTDENVARAALDIVNMVKAAITQNFTAQVNAAALITTHQPYTLDYEVQVNNLMSVDWSKVDAVILFGGANDFANVGQLLGEDSSTNLGETKGALNYIITEFCKTYPNVKINFLTPIVRYLDPPQFSTSKQYNVGDVTMYQGGRYKFINAHSGAWNAADVQSITSYEARVDATWGDNNKNAGNMTLREYGDALEAFVKKVYHITPIDMYNIGWNRVNFDNYFVNTDGTHPLTGFKALAEVMAKKLDL